MQTSVAPAPPARTASLLINRDFALLWLGQTISIVGDIVFDTTLILWIVTQLAAGQPWAPLAASGVLLAASAPVLIVGPLAGVFADRWNQRRTMLAMDATRAVVVALLIPVSGLIAPPLALPFILQVEVLLAETGLTANSHLVDPGIMIQIAMLWLPVGNIEAHMMQTTPAQPDKCWFSM